VISTPDGSGPVRPAMRIYKAENVKPPRSKGRRFVRVLLWTFLVLALLAGAGAGAFYLYVRDAVNTITHASSKDDKSAQSKLADFKGDVPVSKRPAIFLLIGQDRRKELGETRGRSDTLMLVRIDPKKQIVSMLSMPRDWIVDIPGYPQQSITDSFALGGPQLTIDTIKQATGITPNYYVTVDFDAFTKTVDALGGAYIDVDRRYYNLNTGSAATNYNSIDLQPGYQLMNGTQALQYVRQRHDDDDTYRLARQQLFMREFKSKLRPFNVAQNVIPLIQLAKDHLKIIGRKPMSLGDMELYANTLRTIPKNNTVNIRLVGHRAPSDPNKIAIDQPEIDAAVQEFLDPDPSVSARAADATAGKVKKPKKSPAFDQSTFKVEVRNGNGKLGAAASLEAQLANRGWKGAFAHGDAEKHTYFDSVIYYSQAPGAKQAASALKSLVQPSDIQPLDANEVSALNAATTNPNDPASQVQADVVLVVGSTFDGLPPEKVQQLPKDVKAALSSDRSRDVTSWRKAQRAMHHTLMMPTRLPNGTVTADPRFTSYNPFRIYKLRGQNALHVTYYEPSNPAQTTFGVQVLNWDKPPILQAPNQTRTQSGITYLLYFNGAKLHRVAWHWNGRTFWVSNSIVDGLSNSTMWAIATGFRRVP
jgi:LCP family protein required for cell wall assembly